MDADGTLYDWTETVTVPTRVWADVASSGDAAKALLNTLLSAGVACEGDDALRIRATGAGLAAWAVGRDGVAAIHEALGDATP